MEIYFAIPVIITVVSVWGAIIYMNRQFTNYIEHTECKLLQQELILNSLEKSITELKAIRKK